ncbi:MAG: 50S ribosomal protein L11 methyltransferase [Epsilonproteobacteria bacterium]|nr:50S ribosomal protein L11 methyltransferase [Campylobacterota bacterium]
MKDYFFEIIIKSKEDLIELLGDFFTTSLNEAIEIKKDSLIIRTSDLEKFNSALNLIDKEIIDDIKIEKRENIDWIKRYKDSIEPIEIENFYIRPSWHQPKDGKIDIVIDPALAFGSGHHPTTANVIKAISKYIKPNNTLLDVGCGSGILALSAAKLGANVDLCDTDPLAIESAKKNFKLNNENFGNIWLGSANLSQKKYDMVVANIIADVLVAIKEDLTDRLKKDSILILSGILDKKENIILQKYQDLELLEKIPQDEWVTLVYKG